MTIHRLVSQMLNDDVLPYVIHVHGLDIPYQAELRVGGVPKHKSGVVSLRISERGYLTAEYVAHDVGGMSDHMGLSFLGENNCTVVILDTQVEIPVYPISASRTKARTLYSMTNVPRVVVYEGRVSGWLGDPESAMDSATMFMTDFTDIGMRPLTKHLPERPFHGNLSLRGREITDPLLTLEAGEWIVQFHQLASEDNDSSDPLSVADISRQDSSTFILNDPENSILTALRMFLSFQSGTWINTALIKGQLKDDLPWRAGLAFVGRLSTPGYAGNSSWTASDYDTWPGMFARFWTLFNRDRSADRLLNAITHYVSSSAVLQNPQSATYGIVPTRSTLEALVKWWNDLPYGFEFRGEDDNSFIGLLLRALDRAELGRDAGCTIDIEEVKLVIERATHFRNTIDHGSAGRIDDEELNRVIALPLYLHNLARLLISAKLGLRDRHTRGSFYSPKFRET